MKRVKPNANLLSQESSANWWKPSMDRYLGKVITGTWAQAPGVRCLCIPGYGLDGKWWFREEWLVDGWRKFYESL